MGENEHDTVDPRVHIELERLNSATDEINKLEVELDEARNLFRQLLVESTTKVDGLRLKLGLCVDRAKPYYEARICAIEAFRQSQIAAMKFEKANSQHSAAREMVFLAEQGLGGRTLDPAWQEMLNHATQRVNDAEIDRTAAGVEHRMACIKHEAACAKVQSLQKELKRAIAKSRPYYEIKAHYNQLLEQQKLRINAQEYKVTSVKMTYANALKNLEHISDEIHQQRKQTALLTACNLPKQASQDSSESFLEDAQEFVNSKYLTTCKNGCALSPGSDTSDKIGNCSTDLTQSNEWTEIDLDSSSPDDDCEVKSRLTRQATMPNPRTEHEFSGIRQKIKLETNISSWISRSSAKSDDLSCGLGRRQSLDNLLGPTSEKVKEIFSQGIMMLNITSSRERRNSEPKLGLTEEKPKQYVKKLPSPLEKTLTYLGVEDDCSDTESVSSMDMLNEEQIHSLMLDRDIGNVCEQLLGTPMSEVVSFPQVLANIQNQK